MTSIAIDTREAGTVACAPVIEEGDAYVVLIAAKFAQSMRFTLEPAQCRALGEALTQIGLELEGRRKLG
jgi:hypothetical protein